VADNKKYNPSDFEKDTYSFWLKNKLFSPIEKTKSVKNFSIILPPPNVTGHLHLGHA
jgi:valyl-tRNA synthetase